MKKSRFDYQGKTTTNVNGQGKKKRTLDRPKETPASSGRATGAPRTLVGVPNTPRSAPRTASPKAPMPAAKPSRPGASNTPKARPSKADRPQERYAPPTSSRPKARPTTEGRSTGFSRRSD